jgi:phospholipid/cholesterol/gamma-HCH transport system substrate-binding protein
VIPAQPSLLMKLSASLQSVTTSVEALSKNISKVFDHKNRVLLTESLSHIELTTRALSEQTDRVASSIKFAEEMLKNGAQASEGLPGAVKKMNQTLDSVGKTAGEFSKTALSARKVMHKASASLDGISQSLVPSAQVLLRHLDVTAQSLSAFSTELGENPSMLLRGRSPKALGPGEGR